MMGTVSKFDSDLRFRRAYRVRRGHQKRFYRWRGLGQRRQIRAPAKSRDLNRQLGEVAALIYETGAPAKPSKKPDLPPNAHDHMLGLWRMEILRRNHKWPHNRGRILADSAGLYHRHGGL